MSNPDQQNKATGRLWLPIITGASGLLAIVPWFTSFGPVTGETGGLLAAIATTGIIIWLCLLAARRAENAGPLRQALILLACSNLLGAAGNLLRLLTGLGLPAVYIPYLSELLEFVLWALTFIALIRVPLLPVSPVNRWRIVIDVAISFLGMAFILFVIWRLPGLRDASPHAKERLVFYNWMETGNLFVLNMVFVRGSIPRLRRATAWLAAAVALDTVYLVVFQYLTGTGNYDGRILNSLFFVDVCVYIVAAYHFFRLPAVPDDTPSRPAFFAKTNPLPFCTVLGVGILLLLSAAHSPTPSVMILSVGTVLMSCLLLARVGASTRESLRLAQEKFESEQRAQAQKMEAVGRLAGGVAHDFNNLLAVMMANSELASLGLPEGHPSQPDLREIRRAATRGAALTGRLLALGRRQNLRPKYVSPAALLHETRPALQRITGETVGLSIQVLGDIGGIWVDPHDFEQALINLTTNGRDAMSVTGGKLVITMQAQTLGQPLVSDHLGAPPGRYVVVTVTDNGTGMDATTRARLFEPFFSTKEHGRGTGLGLASVFGMVKSAGGGIVVKSAPGQGTTIELWLPEKADAAGAVPVSSESTAASASGRPVVPAQATSAGGETILLVEDEALVRITTQRLLEAKGYVVLAAGDAQEARQIMAEPRAREVKLLLTDVIMPGQTGPMLAADLIRERPKLKVLFMSGYTGDELRSEDFAQVGGQLLVKPFTAADLISRVRQMLGAG